MIYVVVSCEAGLPANLPGTMTTLSLTRLIFQVKDPVALSAWYRKAFGWKIAVDERANQWIELDTGNGITLALSGGAPKKARFWPKIQIKVANVAATSKKLTAKGITMSKISSWETLQWAEGTDPEGNVFQISNR